MPRVCAACIADGGRTERDDATDARDGRALRDAAQPSRAIVQARAAAAEHRERPGACVARVLRAAQEAAADAEREVALLADKIAALERKDEDAVSPPPL